MRHASMLNVRNFTGYYDDKTYPRSRYSLQFYKNNVSLRTLFSIAGSVPTSLRSRHILRGEVRRKKSHLATEMGARLHAELATTRETLGQIGRNCNLHGTASPLNSFKLDIDDGTVKGSHTFAWSLSRCRAKHTAVILYSGCVHPLPVLGRRGRGEVGQLLSRVATRMRRDNRGRIIY